MKLTVWKPLLAVIGTGAVLGLAAPAIAQDEGKDLPTCSASVTDHCIQRGERMGGMNHMGGMHHMSGMHHRMMHHRMKHHRHVMARHHRHHHHAAKPAPGHG